MDEAECRKRGIPTSAFFAYEDVANPNHPRGKVPQECIDACKACPIRLECDEWALQHELHGYWAGRRKNARSKLRKSLGIRLIKTHQIPPWWEKQKV